MITQSSAHQVSAGGDVSRHLNIVPLGFSAADMHRLHTIFEQDRPGLRRYSLSQAGQGDILMVNHDNEAALREQRALLDERPDTPVVIVSRGPLPETPRFHLRGMLLAMKLFALLDKVPVPPPDPAPALTHMPIVGLPAVVAGGFRALVVDDCLTIQKSLEIYLQGMPQIGAVDFADTGEEALRKAKATHYDLIFLDIMMPGIDGYETCGQLRKLAQYKKTPIIMVSGKTSPLDEVKGVIAGCNTYLTKPVEPEAFIKLSRRVLAWLDEYQPDAVMRRAEAGH